MPNTLNVTTLATIAGKSVFQCWALASGFTKSSQQGTVGAEILQLGNLSNASYSILPARFDAGQHTAPNVQWVVFLSGLAHITLPNTTLPISNKTAYATEAWVAGGAYGTILATDVAEFSKAGHLTSYPSGEETRVLQIPIEGGEIPAHTVVDATGPCLHAELVGRKRALAAGLDELD
ncbi:hypothetical protein K488DRAFT_87129 [Vararia minispora EC-137]|uniref:Uncharacterized protein n=1 Tax=Vararia minispora EC-137 TaxID=1314806 RepID=A0ACB8QHL6_9AGAM|nr:hypothetical protein K488DRAFT_87129 [Vararia minispora EC-137]